MKLKTSVFVTQKALAEGRGAVSRLTWLTGMLRPLSLSGDTLMAGGWPDPVFVDSGNGAWRNARSQYTRLKQKKHKRATAVASPATLTGPYWQTVSRTQSPQTATTATNRTGV